MLDLATGTADLALELRRTYPGRRVVGADFSEGMLREGQRKLAARGERAVTLDRPKEFASVLDDFLTSL